MPSASLIIETSSNQLFRVREDGMAHAWLGIEVKRAKGGFVPKTNAREITVRKAFTRLVATEA